MMSHGLFTFLLQALTGFPPAKPGNTTRIEGAPGLVCCCCCCCCYGCCWWCADDDGWLTFSLSLSLSLGPFFSLLAFGFIFGGPRTHNPNRPIHTHTHTRPFRSVSTRRIDGADARSSFSSLLSSSFSFFFQEPVVASGRRRWAPIYLSFRMSNLGQQLRARCAHPPEHPQRPFYRVVVPGFCLFVYRDLLNAMSNALSDLYRIIPTLTDFEVVVTLSNASSKVDRVFSNIFTRNWDYSFLLEPITWADASATYRIPSMTFSGFLPSILLLGMTHRPSVQRTIDHVEKRKSVELDRSRV